MRSKLPLFLQVAGYIKPQDGNGLTLKSGAVDMETYDAVIFTLELGVCNDSGSITGISVQQSATTTDGDFGAMSPTKTIPSKVGTDDNTTASITVYRQDLSAGKRYVRFVFAVSAHSCMVGAVGMGVLPPMADRPGTPKMTYLPRVKG